jgi:uncharacterized repeat protein (TIGR01451 family)
VDQDDLNAGSITNNATASADGTESNTDTVTVDADQLPSLLLDKTSDVATYDAVGNVINYSYLVTNNGNVSLDGPVTIADDLVTATCPDVSTVGDLDAFLDPGESVTCAASHTVDQDDLNAGSITNNATASADGTESNTDTVTVDADQNPAISIDKVTVDGSTEGDGRTIFSGEAISWKYTVTNTGNVTLTAVSVIDDQGVTVSCPKTTLDPGETMVCTASGTAVAGDYTNLSTATSEGPQGQTATDTDTSSYFGADPQISINKVTVDGSSEGDGRTILTGETIGWKYTVVNTGNVALSNVTVTDSQAGVTVSCPKTTLADGESMACTASGTAVTGPYSNTGTASGSFTDSANHTRTDLATDGSSYFGANPQIEIDKVTVWTSSTGDGIPVIAGDPIKWRYTVTNVGNVPLAGVTVADNKPGVTPVLVSGDDGDGLLEAGETWIYEASGTAIAGAYSNVGTATGSFTDSGGHSRSDSETDGSSYFGLRRNQPSISVTSLTMSIVPNTARKTVLGTFNVRDESQSGNQPDGFLIALDEYQVDWEYAKKASFEASDFQNNTLKINNQTVSYTCSYRLLSIDGNTSVAHDLAPGEVVIFDETVDIRYTCTFDTSLPTTGTLRGTVRAGIFNRDMTFIFRSSFQLR